MTALKIVMLPVEEFREYITETFGDGYLEVVKRMTHRILFQSDILQRLEELQQTRKFNTKIYFLHPYI